MLQIGANPTKWVRLTLTGGLAFAIADLCSGDMRVGPHVRGFGDGSWERFVKLEPGTPGPFGPGLIAIAAARRRRAQTLKTSDQRRYGERSACGLACVWVLRPWPP